MLDFRYRIVYYVWALYISLLSQVSCKYFFTWVILCLTIFLAKQWPMKQGVISGKGTFKLIDHPIKKYYVNAKWKLYPIKILIWKKNYYDSNVFMQCQHICILAIQNSSSDHSAILVNCSTTTDKTIKLCMENATSYMVPGPTILEKKVCRDIGLSVWLDWTIPCIPWHHVTVFLWLYSAV